MSPKRLIVVFVVLAGLAAAALLTACQSATSKTSEPETGAQAEAAHLPNVSGKQVQEYYLDSCSGCHSPDRRGATGPALLPGRLTESDAYYANIIKNGKPGTIMPPWGAQLSDNEIDSLVAFMRSEAAAAAVEWTEKDIWASLTVLTPEDKLPNEPANVMNLDNLMLVTEREAQSIAVIDGDTHQLMGKIPASYRAHGYAFHPTDARYAYNMGRDGWVFKIDLFSLKPVRKIRIGLDARSLAISDDGKWLIAGNYMPATMVILNADTLDLVKYFSTNTTDNEGQPVDSRVATIMDTSPDLVGPYFLVALKEAGQVWRIDWSQPNFPVVALEKVGHVLHDGFLSEDNRTFYLAAQKDDWMAAIDVEKMELIKNIETGSIPHPGSGAAWTVGERHYAATTHAGEGKVSVWDTDSTEIIGTVETPGAGLFLRAQENTPYVWADSVFAEEPFRITVFEKEPPFKVVAVIEEGQRTLHPDFTTDGQFVYIADWDANVVRVYNAHSLEKVAEIYGVTPPTGIFNTHRRLEPLGH